MGSPASSPASTGRCRLCCYHRVNDASLPRKLYRIRFFLYFFLVYALLLTAQWPLKRFHRTRTQARRCINQSRAYVSGRSVGGKENEKNKLWLENRLDLNDLYYYCISSRRQNFVFCLAALSLRLNTTHFSVCNVYNRPHHKLLLGFYRQTNVFRTVNSP